MEALTFNLTTQQIEKLSLVTFIGAFLIGMAANFPDAHHVTRMVAALLKSFALYFAFLSLYLHYRSGKETQGRS